LLDVALEARLPVLVAACIAGIDVGCAAQNVGVQASEGTEIFDVQHRMSEIIVVPDDIPLFIQVAVTG
jgi:hypothetical protein